MEEITSELSDPAAMQDKHKLFKNTLHSKLAYNYLCRTHSGGSCQVWSWHKMDLEIDPLETSTDTSQSSLTPMLDTEV